MRTKHGRICFSHLNTAVSSYMSSDKRNFEGGVCHAEGAPTSRHTPFLKDENPIASGAIDLARSLLELKQCIEMLSSS